MSALDVIADLPGAAAQAAGPVAYGAAAAGLAALAAGRRPLAEVLGTWAAGFLALHLVLGLLTDELLLWPIPALLAIGCAGVAVAALRPAPPPPAPPPPPRG